MIVFVFVLFNIMQCMDGYVDGWLGECMDGYVDGWLGVSMDGYVDGWLGECMDGCMEQPSSTFANI